MPLIKTTEMSIVIIVSVLLIGNLVFTSNNYKAVGNSMIGRKKEEYTSEGS